MQRLLQRRVVAVLVLALLVAVVPTAAQAKGASAATISGAAPAACRAGPSPSRATASRAAAPTCPAWPRTPACGRSCSTTVPAASWRPPRPRPTAARYTITWTFPNGAGTEDKVRQFVWPYAAGGPLTFMASGQRVLDGTTKGGWFRATDGLRLTLVNLGLPSRQPLTASTPATSAKPAAPAAQPSADAGPDRARPGARGLASGGRRAGAPPGRGRRRPVLRRRSSPGAATTP